jgi:hypothetical protein
LHFLGFAGDVASHRRCKKEEEKESFQIPLVSLIFLTAHGADAPPLSLQFQKAFSNSWSFWGYFCILNCI